MRQEVLGHYPWWDVCAYCKYPIKKGQAYRDGKEGTNDAFHMGCSFKHFAQNEAASATSPNTTSTQQEAP